MHFPANQVFKGISSFFVAIARLNRASLRASSPGGFFKACRVSLKPRRVAASRSWDYGVLIYHPDNRLDGINLLQFLSASVMEEAPICGESTGR